MFNTVPSSVDLYTERLFNYKYPMRVIFFYL